jgi:addiction module HigA family antidote
LPVFGKPIHPGEILADELEELGITPTELARQLRVPTNRITQIIHGQRGITGDTALRLARWFNMSPQFWMGLQLDYDLEIARDQLGEMLAEIPQRALAEATG